jgi:hypothetical protein
MNLTLTTVDLILPFALSPKDWVFAMVILPLFWLQTYGKIVKNKNPLSL